MAKQCSGCDCFKDASEFHKSRASRDGLQAQCKACIRGYQLRNKERILAQNREREAEFKTRVIMAYGGKCVCCGETERAFLTFDHVNDDGAEHRRSGQSYQKHMARWAARNGYPNSLQILCANCNMAKQFSQAGCPHQTKRTI